MPRRFSIGNLHICYPLGDLRFKRAGKCTCWNFILMLHNMGLFCIEMLWAVYINDGDSNARGCSDRCAGHFSSSHFVRLIDCNFNRWAFCVWYTHIYSFYQVTHWSSTVHVANIRVKYLFESSVYPEVSNCSNCDYVTKTRHLFADV